MAEAYVLNAEVRSDIGKGSSRRLRRLQNKVPAVIYGANKEPKSITVRANELIKQLENEAFYSHVLTLKLADGEEKVVLKDLQRHPARNEPLHADFLRVDATHKISMQVPLHFVNEEKCFGVKMQGGTITHQMAEVEISCLAKDLPEYIEVDLGGLKTGEIVHLSDLKLSEGVVITALTHGPEHDLPVASCVAAKGGSTDEESEEGAAE